MNTRKGSKKQKPRAPASQLYRGLSQWLIRCLNEMRPILLVALATILGVTTANVQSPVQGNGKTEAAPHAHQ